MVAFHLPEDVRHQLGAVFFWEVAEMSRVELEALGIRDLLDQRIRMVYKRLLPKRRWFPPSFLADDVQRKARFCFELQYDAFLMEVIHRFCADEITMMHVHALSDAMDPSISADLTDPHHLLVLNSRETGLRHK